MTSHWDGREAVLLLTILGNQTDLIVTEHATDTYGATLANFALFDLVGLQLSPRIRDLGKITLYRTGPRADFTGRYPASGHLLTRRLNEDLITGMWDDVLRVAASVKGGHASGALVVGKLCSSRRQQNALASAIKEYGALRRTVYAARYLVDETYRRRIGRQLNKGENVHSLKPMLAYAGEGAIRRPHHEEQAEQMWCLTLATNAAVTWTTEYNGLAVTALRRSGRDIDDAVLAHIWPTHPLRRRRRRARQARLRRLPAAAHRHRRKGAVSAQRCSYPLARFWVQAAQQRPAVGVEAQGRTGRCAVPRSGTGEQRCGYQSWSSSRPGMMTFSRDLGEVAARQLGQLVPGVPLPAGPLPAIFPAAAEDRPFAVEGVSVPDLADVVRLPVTGPEGAGGGRVRADLRSAAVRATLRRRSARSRAALAASAPAKARSSCSRR
jgi:hypothetical protein